MFSPRAAQDQGVAPISSFKEKNCLDPPASLVFQIPSDDDYYVTESYDVGDDNGGDMDEGLAGRSSVDLEGRSGQQLSSPLQDEETPTFRSSGIYTKHYDQEWDDDDDHNIADSPNQGAPRTVGESQTTASSSAFPTTGNAGDKSWDYGEVMPEQPPPGAFQQQEESKDNNAKLTKRKADVTFKDHFSLRTPSSCVHYRGKRVMVYDQANDQFLLEAEQMNSKGSINITVKRMRAGTFGLRFLRALYTLVSVLLAGFLFVFCFQLILFLYMNITVQSGITESEQAIKGSLLIGSICAIPLFVHAMGSIMAMATAFVSDNWNGHVLFRALLNVDIVPVEWLCFVGFLGAPALSMAISLFGRLPNWWEVTALVWVICVFILFLMFSIMVVYREFTTCVQLVRMHKPELQTWRALILHMFLSTQMQRFAATRSEKHLVRGVDHVLDDRDDNLPVEISYGLYSRLTSMFCSCMFDTLEEPERRYSVEEVREIVPFVTRTSWSLEKMFCHHQYKRLIYAVGGEDALQESQSIASASCNLVGLLLVVLLVGAFFTWAGIGDVPAVVIIIILLFCCVVPSMRSTMHVIQTFRTVKNASGLSDNTQDPEQALGNIHAVWKTYTIAKPKVWYCWSRFCFSAVVFFVLPLFVLWFGSEQVGALFTVFGFTSALRIYFDAGWVLSEIGTLNALGQQEKLVILARTSEIMGKVTRSRSAIRWMWAFGIFSLAILGMSLMAVSEDYAPQGGRPPIVLLDDFYYPPQPDLAYPTCRVAKGVSFPASQQGLEGPSLLDYSFVAALSYETPAITQLHFDKWFGGNNIVVDEAAYVRQYRNATDTTDNPVFFKLLTFPSQPGAGIVAIRGSQTKADFLVDVQLWSGAALMQLVRAFIPFGWIWNPILDDLVTIVNFIESDRLKELSYYKVTSRFINDLLDNNYTGVTAASGGKEEQFTRLSVTGASLGGGIAIISGAQTRANAIAISGINAVLSRHSFSPPLAMQALNDQTFNVIPDRDIVAHVGDHARLYQRLQCRAPASSFFGCHSMWRSVCELSYMCGTQELDRPVLCRCVQKLGYPEPLPKPGRRSNLTFAERCALVTAETPV